ncbi:Dreadlocks [Strongyloides ratti]|uniref:Dreadlocks n=1 Tax=Strongyloides ratti TaxID=34506 RepID=A0A090L9U6_STRRB|nr:Dreadlocks [Strongyloides ratti]CEF64913.1 Dreadlocks [Strongyloides ratti]
MNFECQICFELFTSPGTKHAPYSASCGHIIGKSCIQKLKKYKCKDEFNCPFCNKIIKFENFHPIYLMGDEIINVNSNISNKVLSNNTNKLKDTKKQYNLNEIKSISLNDVKKINHKTDFFNSVISNLKIIDNVRNKTLLEMSNYPFYYGKISRSDAENYLNLRGTVGDYLLRDSESHLGNFTISLKGNKKNRHYLIIFDNETNNCIIGKRIFESFESFIDYFKLHPIYISSDTDEQLFLIKPLPKNIV